MIAGETKLDQVASFQLSVIRVGLHLAFVGHTVKCFPFQRSLSNVFLCIINAQPAIAAFKVIPKVEPWPLAELPWGFTSDFYHLGVHMVIDDPLKWEWPKIAIIGGSKAIFKFVHKTGPIMSSCHLYDHVVRLAGISTRRIHNIHLKPTQGNELIEEGDGHGHSTLFFISKKNPYPNPEELKSKIANGEVKAFVFKKVKPLVLQNQNMFHPPTTRPKRRRQSSRCTLHHMLVSTSWKSMQAESQRQPAR